MVVSRPPSLAAVPSASRPPSSQQIPTKHSNKEKEKETTRVASTLTSTPTTGKKQRRKDRLDAIQQQQGATFFDKLFLFSLFAFALWAAAVCPNDDQGRLTCRALSSYRTHILEPYVVPPVKAAYVYTSQSPLAAPVFEAVHKVDDAVRPHWVRVTEVVVPWYKQAFLPRWNTYVAPRLAKGWEEGVKGPLLPYYSLLEAETSKLHKELGVHLADLELRYVRPLRIKVQPYMEKAQAIWSTAKPHIVNTWALAKTHSIATWTAVKPHLCNLLVKARIYSATALKEFVTARRQFVDPHIKKILEKVDGDGGQKTTSPIASLSQGFKSSMSASAAFTKEADHVVSELVAEPTEEQFAAEADEGNVPAGVPIPTTPIAEEFESELEEAAASPITDVADASVTPSHVEPPPAVPTESAEEYEEDYLSIPVTPTPSGEVVQEAREHGHHQHSQEIEEELRALHVAQESAPAASNIHEQLADPSGPVKNLQEGVKAKLEEAASEESLDLDEFLSDLGISEEDSDLTSGAEAQEEALRVEDEPEPIPEGPTPEERKAETARKRADIVARHTVWQQKLDDAVIEQEKRVFLEIEGIRKWAAQELGSEFAAVEPEQLKKVPGLPSTKYRAEPQHTGDGLGKRVLVGIAKQGERLVRGLDTYIGNLESRIKPEDSEEDREKERTKWKQVLSKVEERFAKLISDVHGEVSTWYNGVRARELEPMRQGHQVIRGLAEEAQADLAMDYAWLDDVTVKDWGKYHKLMFTADDFEKEIAPSIQNLTYVPDGIFQEVEGLEHDDLLDLVRDPIEDAMNALQAKFNDIVAGLQRSFVAVDEKAEFVITGRSPPFAATTPSAREEQVTVPIVPPSPTPTRAPGGQDDVVEDISKILVGKDKVQMEDVLKAVWEEEEARRDRVEL